MRTNNMPQVCTAVVGKQLLCTCARDSENARLAATDNRTLKDIQIIAPSKSKENAVP